MLNVLLLLVSAATTDSAPAIEEAPTLGAGRHTYRWTPGFCVDPDGKPIGNTHGGIAFDSRGRMYFTTDTERAIIVLDEHGKYATSIASEYAGGIHSLLLRREGDQEFLYFTHHAKGVAVKMSLDGETIWSLGAPMESGKYGAPGEYHPTSLAIAKDGRIYVADGYGTSWIHQYDPERKYVKSFGGYGTGDDQMRTCHGLWIDARSGTEKLLVADRENQRLQLFDLDGKHLRVIAADVRRPCGFSQFGDDLAVADLAGRVTILDREFAVVTHLGDQPDPAKRAQNGVPVDQWRTGEFISPHGCAFDAKGNLYVMDWVSAGRVTRLERVASGK
jgi:sugar lactone lactonase YvrE